MKGLGSDLAFRRFFLQMKLVKGSLPENTKPIMRFYHGFTIKFFVHDTTKRKNLLLFKPTSSVPFCLHRESRKLLSYQKILLCQKHFVMWYRHEWTIVVIILFTLLWRLKMWENIVGAADDHGTFFFPANRPKPGRISVCQVAVFLVVNFS